VSVTTLVLSNPPYGVFDGRCAAPVLGLTAADVGLKAHYPVPEIWLAPEDRPAAEDAAGRLERCGLPVVVAPAHALADVPARTHVSGFAFEDVAMRLAVPGQSTVVPYELSVVAVFCRPREGGPTAPTFLDLYASQEGRTARYGFVQDRLDFTGIPAGPQASAAANMMKLAAECEQRFALGIVDRRLVNMVARQRHVGTGGQPAHALQRKGFSFATVALDELLDGIRPGLREMDQFELCSRLAYLTRCGV